MKKQTNAAIKAHIIRGASYLLLLLAGTVMAFSRPPSPTKIFPGTLSFAERVAYQRAIEDVYWRHRIWPKGNPNPKPSLDAAMSQAQLEKRVEDYLLNSEAVEDYNKEPLSAEQLQAEMDRMAQQTRQPEVLRELCVRGWHVDLFQSGHSQFPALSEHRATSLSTRRSVVAARSLLFCHHKWRSLGSRFGMSRHQC